ncbi:MAG TPA: DUF6569 family protein [Candidatus Polarisedimenticolia bacterium]|jgi:hypothetical protein
METKARRITAGRLAGILSHAGAALLSLLAAAPLPFAQTGRPPIRVLGSAGELPAGGSGGSAELRALLDRVAPGAPITPHGMGHVRVYPLIPMAGRAGAPGYLFQDPGYLSLDEALGRGALLVSEKPSPTVPGLDVENIGERPVLILAGEILVGGKQNRILQSDLLLPPHSGRRDVTAFCVEHGRWTAGESSFGVAGAMAPAGVRQSAARRSAEAQSDVWRAIGQVASEAGAPASPTQSLHDVMKDPKVEARAAPRIESVKESLPADAVGMIAVANGTIYSFDLFCSAPLFEKYREKIVRAAMIGAPEQVLYFKAPAEPDVMGFLQAARQARAAYFGSAGLGSRVELTGGGVRGEALAVEGRAVHTALFLW